MMRVYFLEKVYHFTSGIRTLQEYIHFSAALPKFDAPMSEYQSTPIRVGHYIINTTVYCYYLCFKESIIF